MPYDELTGWIEYFNRRPFGWREDHRTYIIASSFGGGKLKPEDMFPSLRVIRKESEKSNTGSNVGQKFYERFKNKLVGAKDPFRDDNK